MSSRRIGRRDVIHKRLGVPPILDSGGDAVGECLGLHVHQEPQCELDSVMSHRRIASSCYRGVESRTPLVLFLHQWHI